jgi:aspartate aminotransferase-like enzyme
VPDKRYLFTPGPTPVPPQVLEAMSRPIIHHRSSDFREILQRTFDRLGEVYRTEGDVLVYTSSGTGGMESAISNLTRPGNRVVVVSAGHFGERWAAMAGNFGCDVDMIEYEWGESPSADDLAARLAETGGAKVVFLTHSETSTGVVADVQSLAAAAKESGALVVVDAVSSLGAVPVETDSWGLDAVVSGSQKALMTPPGLATVSVSSAAWAVVEKDAPGRYYFDWHETRERQEQFDPAFTPAVSIVVGLDVALGLLLEEGLEQAFERHTRLGRACRAGVRAMGLELFSPDDDRSAVVTAITAPDGIDSGELVQTLRDRQGIVLAPGQGPLKGKVFRIGHIGYYDVFDITTALAGVELVLAELGADIERGAAITAALEAFEHTRV